MKDRIEVSKATIREINSLAQEHGLDNVLDLVNKNITELRLDEQNGVVAEVARILGVKRTTLVERLRRFGISPQEYRKRR